MRQQENIDSHSTHSDPPGLRGGLFALFVASTVAIFVLWQTRPVSYVHGEPADTISIGEPAAEELRELPNRVYGNALIAELAEEIYVRDGVSMGLVHTDTVIRQRIIERQRQAMTPETLPISDDELRTWFSAHREQFRRPRTFSFEQRFFRRNNDEELQEAIEMVLDTQNLPARIGDPFVHGTSFGAQTEHQIRTLFGREFARAISTASLHDWFGPVSSNFGRHMVRVDNSTEPHVPSFEEVQQEARAAWQTAARVRLLDERISELRDRYTVVIPDQLPPTE